jgi:hypothetical protein
MSCCFKKAKLPAPDNIGFHYRKPGGFLTIPVHSLQAKTISLASNVNMTSSESNFMQIPVMRERISAEYGSRKCALALCRFVPVLCRGQFCEIWRSSLKSA